MARLLYMAITSLDGYVADEKGTYDWAMPDDEVFGFVNDFERPVGTYLYGRRLYQEMTGWETVHARVFSCRTDSGSKSRSSRVLAVDTASSDLE